jgi:hypothetical protein
VEGCELDSWGPEYEPVAGSYETGNETSGFTKFGEFVSQEELCFMESGRQLAVRLVRYLNSYLRMFFIKYYIYVFKRFHVQFGGLCKCLPNLRFAEVIENIIVFIVSYIRITP